MHSIPFLLCFTRPFVGRRRTFCRDGGGGGGGGCARCRSLARGLGLGLWLGQGKKVEDNVKSASKGMANVGKKREHRQYMNRRGGFGAGAPGRGGR